MAANLGKVALTMLGILAFQNRDKIGELIRNASKGNDPNNPQGGGVLDQISKEVSGTALGDVLDRFRGAGAGAKVDSWVQSGPDQPVEPHEVEAAIDDETLSALERQTGLSRTELIARITRDLPEAIDKMTPDGALPPATASTTASGSGGLLDDVPPRAG